MTKYLVLIAMFMLSIAGGMYGAYLNDRELMVLLGLPGIAGIATCAWAFGRD